MFIIIYALWDCASCHQHMPAICDYTPHNCYDITKAEQRRMAQYCQHYRRSDKEVWTVML